MTNNQGFNAYRETGIKTASQGKLIVMMYDEAIKQVTAALGKIGANSKIKAAEIEGFAKHIAKAQDIITELMVSLDMEKGGDVAKNLMTLYTYFNRELLDANISMNKDKLQFIAGMLTQLHESWVLAAAKTAEIQPAPTRPALDIKG
jgi:flagellar protein FliS